MSSAWAERVADDLAPSSTNTGYPFKGPLPSADEWGLNIARAVATGADCVRRQVGAVIVVDRRVISVGYNGAPVGQPGCLTAGACPRAQSSVAPGSSYDTGAGACIALHAEQVAIMQADWHQITGGTMYVTDQPCEGCIRMLKGSPLSWVVTPTGGGAI